MEYNHLGTIIEMLYFHENMLTVLNQKRKIKTVYGSNSIKRQA